MIKVPMGYFCGFDCATEKTKNKANEIKSKKIKKDIKERKEKIKTNFDFIKEELKYYKQLDKQ